MTKVLAYKLALLGCASTCLITAAQANDEASSEAIHPIQFVGEPVEYRNVACGSEARYATYTIMNKGIIPVTFRTATITANSDQTLSEDDLAQILPPSDDHHDCGYGVPGGFPFTLEPFRTCNFTIEVNPSAIADCSPPITGTDLIPTGTVDRTFKLSFTGLPFLQRSISTTVDYDMTYLGSTDSFALVGDSVHDTPYISGASILASPIQVNQDVAVTHRHGHLSSHIEYYDDSRPYIADTPFDGEVAVNAGYDAYAAFTNLYNLIGESYVGCTITITSSDLTTNGDLSGYIFDNGDSNTVFCFDDTVTLPLQISDTNGPVTFTGTGQSIIIIDDTDDEFALQIQAGADFDCSSTTAYSDIYWAINGNVSMDPGTYRVAGNFVIDGAFEVTGEDANPGQVVGRIVTVPGYGYDEDEIRLGGNSIVPPEDYSCSSMK